MLYKVWVNLKEDILMTDIIVIVLAGLIFFSSVFIAGILQGFIFRLFTKWTKRTQEKEHENDLKYVKSLFYFIAITAALFLLFKLITGTFELLPLLFALFFAYFLLSLFDWGLAMGIEKRYVSPSQFLEILRK